MPTILLLRAPVAEMMAGLSRSFYIISNRGSAPAVCLAMRAVSHMAGGTVTQPLLNHTHVYRDFLAFSTC